MCFLELVHVVDRRLEPLDGDVVLLRVIPQRGMNRHSRARLLSGRSRNVSDPDDWLDFALVCAIYGVAVVCIACAFFGLVQP